jgi:aminoglycoside phosphotransferase (APT) family kinase protein
MELMARGRDADVYVIDEERVLRRYRDGRSAHHEAELITRLVDAGFPTPRALGCDGPDLILERVVGPDLMTAVGAGALTTQEAGAALADLHRRLHALPWDGGVLLHLDLHPINVLWTAHGPVLLDWTNAALGAPGLDVAVTAMILAQVVVAPDAFTDVGVDDRTLGEAPAHMLAALAATAEPFADHLGEAAARRRRNPNTGPRERETLGEALRLARSVARGGTVPAPSGGAVPA